MTNTTTNISFQLPTSDHTLTELAEELAFELSEQGGFTFIPTGSPVGSFVRGLGPDVAGRFTCEVAPLTTEDAKLSRTARYVCAVENLEELTFDVGAAIASDGSATGGSPGSAVIDWDKFQDLTALLRANLLRTQKWVEVSGQPGVIYGYGLWNDEGSVCFDIVALYTNKADALAQAKRLNERAIFDLANCEDIANPDYVADTSEDENSEGQTIFEWVKSVEQYECHSHTQAGIFFLSDEFGEGTDFVLTADWADPDEEELEVLAVINFTDTDQLLAEAVGIVESYLTIRNYPAEEADNSSEGLTREQKATAYFYGSSNICPEPDTSEDENSEGQTRDVASENDAQLRDKLRDIKPTYQKEVSGWDAEKHIRLRTIGR